MAEAVVSSERSNLERGLDEVERTVLTPQFGDRISDFYGLKEPVAVVKDELKELIGGSLKDIAETRVRQLISDIAEAVFDLDDIVTRFGYLVDGRLPRNSVKKEMYVPDDEDDELNKARIDIRRTCTRVSNLRRSLEGCGVLEDSSEGTSSAITLLSDERRLREWRRAYSSVESNVDYVVGFEENIKELVEQLTREGEGEGDDLPRVFCILGMGGIGKTTLAKQIYCHSEIRSHFDSFAWLSVSDDQFYHGRKFNLSKEILIQLTCSGEAEKINRVKQMNDYDSCVDLYHELRKRKFLLILDDVLSHGTLENFILNAFPKYKRNWKILITTRKKGVADKFPVHKNVFVHEPRFLDENQSWELFEKKANFGRDAIKDSEDYYQMKELGQKMLEHCAGLPLAITVLGELLSKRHTLNEWKEMLLMKSFIYDERRKDHDHLKYSDILWVLRLGYYDLPRILRQYLLHLAHFPKDSEIIKVKELCRIWKAEDIMLINEDHEATNRHFNQLKDESMIQVEKLDSYGRIKTIRIHNLMRDSCITSDKDEKNFWKIMDSRKEMDQYSSTPDTFEDVRSTSKTHRVAIHVNRDVAEEFFPLINNDRKVDLRALICFNRLPYPSYEKVIQPLLKRFHKLRVLKFENISYGYVGKLPEEIGELVHLRFLSLKGSHVEQVPSSIGNLILLQTLDLRTNWKSEFPNVLWNKLNELKHLYLPHRCHISGKKLMFSSLMKLETLVNIPLRHCDLNDLETTYPISSVRKLKVYFRAYLWKNFNLERSGAYPPRHLESLALENLSRLRVDIVRFLSRHPTRKLHLEGKITQLPEAQFVPHLTKITLERTHLQNDPMETLAKLPKLKILLLKHNAFEGNTMVCSHDGFPRLEYLSLIALEQLEEWKVEKGALSSLSNLLIEDCYKLLTIPSGLGYVTNLNKLVIKRMPREFTMKVGERGNDFYKVQHVPSVELVD